MGASGKLLTKNGETTEGGKLNKNPVISHLAGSGGGHGRIRWGIERRMGITPISIEQITFVGVLIGWYG